MHKNKLLLLIGVLVIVLGITGYILYSKTKTPVNQTQPSDSQSVKFEQQSSSDDTSSIEKDLNNTDLDDIDKESKSIQTEINSTN
jgi:predicted negative regulator of RcsB-dependent stress response